MKKEKVYNEAVSGDEGFAPGDGYPSCDGEPCANVSDETDEATDTMADGESVADADAAKALEAAVARWQDKYVRLQAEFDNYRKRTLKEKMDLVQTGGRDVLLAMLPVRDDVQRAVDAMQKSDDIEALRAGVNLISQKFTETLRQKGVTEIDVKGREFDADLCEAVAKFAAGGKEVKKKDLGAILMTYGYVYVAQVAMGYDQAQTLKALREAESYPGPAIVICYCPCLEQHIKAGMGTSQDEMKKAVECGYWPLFRYSPELAAEGKNPFQLDSPAPDTDKLMDFLMGENRFASLKNNFPERADALYQKEIADVKARYQKYRKMAED